MLKADILFSQRLLSSGGLYKGPLDGKWNAQMDTAEAAFDAFYNEQKAKLGAFDPRSERNIASLLPKAQVIARAFMAVAVTAPFQVKMLSGLRTYAEQNALFAQGRTKPGPKVTNARGGQSNHNFGIAWDVGIFVDGVYYTGKNAKQERAYDDLGALVKSKFVGVLGWGGDWKKMKDKPHYQLVAGDDVDRCRKMLEAGKPYA
jgi:peptidoglycan L-alanyl-D-glutamate endopeptidase CwlK